MHNPERAQDLNTCSQKQDQFECVSSQNQKGNTILDFGQVMLPKIFKISENKYGYCLLATQNLKKGDLVYKSKVKIISSSVSAYKFTIDGKEYVSNCVNSVKIPNGSGRQAYTFDGFMNHCCDPNTMTRVLSKQCDEFENFAAKDINIGDQISVNYLQFDYECHGHSFQCLCGSQKCYKSIMGFKNLNFADKLELLPKVYPTVMEAWLKDNPQIILIDDLKLPEGLEIYFDQRHRKISAKKEFKKDEVIFATNPLLVKQDSVIVIKLGQKYEALDLMSHTVNKNDFRQFFYFCSFMNHSCEPNTAMISQEGKIGLVCTRDVKIGEQITYDYTMFDAMSDAEQFNCQCKSKHCRGVVEGRKKESKKEVQAK